MFTQVAIFTLLAENGAGAFELSIAAVMFWLPAVIISPFSGVVADRFSPKLLLPTLIATEIVSTLMFLGATDKDQYWTLLGLLFIRSSAGVAYYQTTMALLPKVLEGEELQKANEIHSIIYSFCLTAGMALGGVVVYYFGVIMAFLIDAGLYCFGFYILLKTTMPRMEPHIESAISMLVDGARYLLGSKIIIFIMATHAVVATTLFDAIVTLLAKNRYAEVIAIPLAIGFINAIRALSAVLGPLYLSKIANKTTIGYFMLIEGLFLIVWFFLSESFYSSLLGAFLAGIMLTTIWSYTMTMLQEVVDERYYGRVIAYNDMFFTTTAVVSSVFIGFVLDMGVDERYGIVLIGVLFLVVGTLYFRLKSRFL